MNSEKAFKQYMFWVYELDFCLTSIWLVLDPDREELAETSTVEDSSPDTKGGVALKEPCVLQPSSEMNGIP